MNLNASIGKESFDLPLDARDLYQVIQEKFGDPKYILNKKGFHKIYPIDFVDSHCISQKINIFLLNLVLLVDNLNDKKFIMNDSISNDYLLQLLVNQIGYDCPDDQTFDKLSKKDFQKIEEEIDNLYLLDKKTEVNKKLSNEIEKSIDFSIKWVKEKDNQIKRKENEDDQYFGIH